MTPSGKSVIVKNAVGLFALQFVVKGLSAVWSFYLARRLGVANYGLWASVLALTSIFGVLQGFGILGIVVKDVSQSPSKSPGYFGTSILMYLAASSISFVLVLATAYFLGYPHPKLILVAAAALSFILFAPGLASQSILYGHEEFIFFTTLSSVGTALYIALGVLAVETHLGVLGVFGALCSEYALLSIFLYFKTSRKYGAPDFEGAKVMGTHLLRLGMPLVLSSVLVELMLRADRVVIEHFLGESAVGYYHAAFNIVYLPREVFIIPLVTAVYTRMCSSFANDRATFERLFEKMNTALLLVGLPIAGFCVLMPQETIRIFYGQGYPDSARILSILVWMLPPSFFVIVWQNVFIMQNRTKMIFILNLAGTVFNLALNILLIPRLGVIASAATAVATQFLMLILIFWDLRREPLFNFSRRTWRIALSCACSLILIYFLKPEAPGRVLFFGLFVVGAISYAAFLYVLGGVSKEETLWLKNQFRAYQEPLREALGLGID